MGLQPLLVIEYSLVVCVQLKKYSFYIYIFLRERMGLQPLLVEYGFLTKLQFSHSIHYACQKV